MCSSRSRLWLACLVLMAGGRTFGADEKDAPRVSLAVVGDIMLDRDPGQAMLAGRDPFAHVANVLDGADVTLGNLECVVAKSGKRLDKSYTFRADPRAIPLIANHFDGVSLANNHTGDFGHEALVETMDRLTKANVRYFGAGMNNKEAHTPWIVEKNGLKIAVLGYNEFRPRSFEAGPTTPGSAWSEDAAVVADIKAAKEKADRVITFMHWGEEYKDNPNERQTTFARTMIDAGADVVIGNHPHVVQGTETYKGKLIVYSLGNFVFDEYKDSPRYQKEARRIGWVLRLTFDRSGLAEWDTVVTRTDDEGIPRLHDAVTGPSGKREASAVPAGKSD